MMMLAKYANGILILNANSDISNNGGNAITLPCSLITVFANVICLFSLIEETTYDASFNALVVLTSNALGIN